MARELIATNGRPCGRSAETFFYGERWDLIAEETLMVDFKEKGLQNMFMECWRRGFCSNIQCPDSLYLKN